MFVISACALFFTAYWNKGFILPTDFATLILAVVLLALVFYVLVPLSKVVLLPLNVVTLGLVSFLVYIALLHFSSVSYRIFEVTSWNSPNTNLLFMQIPSFEISYLVNLVLSSVSLSSIINLLELLL